MKKKILFLFLIIAYSNSVLIAQKLSCSHKYSRITQSSPNAVYSDTIDVISYQIHLNITNISGKIIVGNTNVKIQSKVDGLSVVKLDLLKLTIDSIKNANNHLNYTYNDTTLFISVGTLNQNDTINLEISYKGNPKKDASNWGGWYWDNGYTYNLGVGFDANPHSYGRVWHPCLDNFVERATYEYYITTPIDQKAFCGGILQNEITNANNTKTWHWKQQHTIPAYLASVTMAKYATINQNFNGINGNIPIQIGALASDTTNVKASFINLNNCLHTFESRYGPYSWERVGYNMVPFSSGAMEHSCNITYPRVAANGGLGNEDLMAHELAHSWWGNLVTCDDAGEMWINEGNASYCEYLFFEEQYGRERYNTEMKASHRNLLQFLHINEGYKAISGVSHSDTYSDHVYKKGADVIHTLRGYLGDSLYFGGSTAFLNNYQYQDVNTQTYSDFLTTYSGIDCSHFFNDWIRTPGWVGFSVDSFRVIQNSTTEYEVNFTIKQRLKGRNTYSTNIPLHITFYDSDWNKYTVQILTSGNFQNHTVLISIDAKMIVIDENELINDAVTEGLKVIKTTGTHDFGNGLMSLQVNHLSDSALIRVEHHWTAPDTISIAGTTISKSRFWKVMGLFPDSIDANATLFYNGRTSAQSGTNYLDTWITGVEDSLKVLYRKDASEQWRVWENYTQNKFTNSSDKYGTFTLNSIKQGEYCIGKRNLVTGITDNTKIINSKLIISPNPATNLLTVTYSSIPQHDGKVEIYNALGVKMKEVIGKTLDASPLQGQTSSPQHDSSLEIDISDLTKGIYLVKVGNESVKVVVE